MVANACRSSRGLYVEKVTRINPRTIMASDSAGRKLVVRLQYADCFLVSSSQLDSVLTEIRKVCP